MGTEFVSFLGTSVHALNLVRSELKNLGMFSNNNIKILYLPTELCLLDLFNNTIRELVENNLKFFELIESLDESVCEKHYYYQLIHILFMLIRNKFAICEQIGFGERVTINTFFYQNNVFRIYSIASYIITD